MTGQPGVCSAGTQACSGGALVCNQTVFPGAESCNSLDDDCDGITDEGNPGGGVGCSTGLAGVCATGATMCSGGAIVCNQTVFPGAESCNSLDDDCDGITDDGNPGGGLGCSTGLQGICNAGTTACSGGAIVCNQTNMPVAENCADGLDNDCNGVVNNGCCVQAVVDGSFEGGTPNAWWTEFSLIYGTPLCTTAGCGTGGGTGPRTGLWWSWFGGYDGYEMGSMTQDVTIPVGTATLSFWLEIPECAGTIEDTLIVTIDGVQVLYFDNGNPSCDVVGYAQQSVDVSAYADGGVHTLEFVSEVYGTGVAIDSITNFFVDDVSLLSCVP
jgi:hypothetical protein